MCIRDSSITARKLADNEKKAPHESPVIVTGGGTGKEKKIYATRRKVGPSKEQERVRHARTPCG
eukprot:6490174-Prymnesium_polylepis.3